VTTLEEQALAKTIACPKCGAGAGKECINGITGQVGGGFHIVRFRAADERRQEEAGVFKVGARVEKFTGDYQLRGEVRARFTTKAGKTRYVVEHDPGFLHIYSAANLRAVRDA
jgi:hypothetical protein